jgi:hypothetical protein
MTRAEIWAQADIVEWSGLLLDSFRHWTGRDLIERAGTAAEQAQRLFDAPFVVVSHGTQADPILNYGNRVALTLWETDWVRFTAIPSRLTAESVNRDERERMLAAAAGRGYIDEYRGVRISTTGRRFLVEDALVWNVVDGALAVRGQAATFSRWKPLG